MGAHNFESGPKANAFEFAQHKEPSEKRGRGQPANICKAYAHPIKNTLLPSSLAHGRAQAAADWRGCGEMEPLYTGSPPPGRAGQGSAPQPRTQTPLPQTHIREISPPESPTPHPLPSPPAQGSPGEAPGADGGGWRRVSAGMPTVALGEARSRDNKRGNKGPLRKEPLRPLRRATCSHSLRLPAPALLHSHTQRCTARLDSSAPQLIFAIPHLASHKRQT